MPATDIHDPAVATSGTRAEEADIAVAEELGRHRRHPVIRVLGAMSEVADQAPSYAICGTVLAAGLAAGKPRLAEAGARMLASVLVAAALKSAVKASVSRTRPHKLLDEGHYDVEAGNSDDRDKHSFPSGHTAGAVAAARGWARACPDLIWPAYGTAAAIALVQVPRAKHYPADIAGGVVVGLAAEAIVAWGAKALRDLADHHDGAVPRPASVSPTEDIGA